MKRIYELNNDAEIDNIMELLSFAQQLLPEAGENPSGAEEIRNNLFGNQSIEEINKKMTRLTAELQIIVLELAMLCGWVVSRDTGEKCLGTMMTIIMKLFPLETLKDSLMKEE